jgi:ribosomal protein S7
VLVGAAGVRDELARAEAALARGEPEEAGAAVQAAPRNLQVAAAVPERREVRVAARVLVLAGGSRTPGGCWPRRPG